MLFPTGAAPEHTRLTIHTEHTADPVAVLAALRNFGGSGWLCLTNRVVAIAGGDVPDGLPLSAEVSDGAGRSLHVRQDTDGWSLLHYTEAADAEQGVLRFDETYESSRPGGGWRMGYRLYWGLKQEGEVAVWRPLVGVFDGWKGRND